MLETKCQENARAIAQQMKNGGSGSDVEVTQIQATGTKIATIEVDDVSTDLYAPDFPNFKLVNLSGALTSVPANSYATIALTGSIPSGYTAIAILSCESGNTGIDIESFSVNNVRVYNNTGSAKDSLPEAVVLCSNVTLDT